MKKGKLIIICGPSGTGKKTVWSGIIDNPKYNTIFSVSMTTRTKRPDEVQNKDYIFVTEEQFKTAIAENKMLEWAIYVNNYYGTPREFVETNLAQGKNVFLEIEMQGVLNVLKNWPHKEDLLSIFIIPPSLDDLKNRLLNRKTESEEIIQKRIKQSQWELTQKDKFDYVIINDKVAQAKKELETILNKSLLNK